MNNIFKVIMYNEDEMCYFSGKLESIHSESLGFYTENAFGSRDFNPTGTQITLVSNDFKESETIKLDETMMKRIVKYNKEQELKQLNETIENKKKELKELENIINDRDKRINKLKKYISNLWNIDTEDDYEDYYD